MSRRDVLDAVIVGAGVVGAAGALALARRGLRVALVEAQPPKPWRAEAPDLRVYAFAPDNAALLDKLGVWSGIAAARAQPYRHMRVWDAAGGGELRFDAETLGRDALGWIVEHGLLVDRLWAALGAAGVRVLSPERVVGLVQDEDTAALSLDTGTRLRARLAIAADGADSALRDLAGLAVDRRDYGQKGIVAYVETARPHESTAWQRFLPGGPLAFLPCTEGRSSIVWTVSDDEATRLLALDDAAFSRELTRAFDATLGEVRVAGKRAAFPLRRQLAKDYVAGRVALCGDAAHVVHPLAGQGVNLGLRDVAALCDLAADASAHRGAHNAARAFAAHRLARWQRARRSDNAAAAWTFDGLNRLFSNDAVAATLVRGHLLGLAGRVPLLTNFLGRRAAGA